MLRTNEEIKDFYDNLDIKRHFTKRKLLNVL